MSKFVEAVKPILILRKIGGLLVLIFVFILLFTNLYDSIGNKSKLKKLYELKEDGEYAIAILDDDKYVTRQIRYSFFTDFDYSFDANDKKYSGSYTYNNVLPVNDIEKLIKIVTVRYKKDNPKKHSLNIDYEIEKTNKEIEETSILWQIIKSIICLILGLMIIVQFRSIVHYIKNYENITLKVFNKNYE